MSSFAARTFFWMLFAVSCISLACNDSGSSPRCGNGVLESGEECDDGNQDESDRCRSSCTLARCGDGVIQPTIGETCDTYPIDGIRCGENCLLGVCGDGVLDPSEECDDGNRINSDHCTNQCLLAVCGDGFVLQGVEACDDGNAEDADGCRNGCVLPTCGDGVVDPGEQCDDGDLDNEDTCLTTCLLNRCGDGFLNIGMEACDDGNVDNQDGCSGSCELARCGDGHIRTGREACDDGNQVNDDGCTNECALPRCGDGVVQAGEGCDDGNLDDSDDCTRDCLSAVCGDGILHNRGSAQEACDDGNSDEGDSCSNACSEAFCGDGVVWVGVEMCDDGNLDDTDNCRNDCRPKTCGDGIIQAGEECDDGNQDNDDGCTQRCLLARCGDGIVQAGEACDDGNDSSFDSCVECQPARCGDGVVHLGVEACDDGNAVEDDQCTSTCRRPRCGDGIVQGNEECDDGNENNTDGCLTSCVVARCGDGWVQTGFETCDDGNRDQGDRCLTDCTPARCGDGHLLVGVEQCDDGNTDESDGCSSDCTVARCGDGRVQAGEACDDGNNDETDSCLSDCRFATCGDGIVRANVEACDDGNLDDTDQCRNTCRLPSCGDGIVQAREECDDGNGINGDGCTNACLTARCGDGYVHQGVEVCDDGNANDGDACLSTCQIARCGDGAVQIGVEDCDDGNLDDRDDCLSSCVAARCGDGVLNVGREQCDDGNTDNTDGCLSGCISFDWCALSTPVQVTPDVVCQNQVPASIRLQALERSFVFVSEQPPRVTLAGRNVDILSREDCSPVLGALTDATQCRTITVAMVPDLGSGDHLIVVTSPTTQSCTLTSLIGIGLPAIPESIEPEVICEGDESIDVIGANFLARTRVLVDENLCNNVSLINVDRIRASLPPLAPGVYDVTTENGNDCGGTLPDALEVVSKPIPYYVDPPIVYAGVPMGITVFIAGVNGGNVDQVVLRRSDGQGVDIPLNVDFDPARNRAYATVPVGLVGPLESVLFDVQITDAVGCVATMEDGLRITGEASIALREIRPRFGWTQSTTAVSIFGEEGANQGLPPFVEVPRVYLASADNDAPAQARAINSVAFNRDDQITGQVRSGFTPGVYDLIVINPDGRIGVLEDAFGVSLIAPPLINDVAPGSLPSRPGQKVVIYGRFAQGRGVLGGGGFNQGGSGGGDGGGENEDPVVQLRCKNASGEISLHQTSLVEFSENRLELTVEADQIENNSVCVVRVTQANATYAEFSAIGVTNPAENITNSRVMPDMVESRRMPIVGTVDATRAARYIFAMGGDGGSGAEIKDSIEVASLDEFGALAAFRTLRRRLPEPRTDGATVVVDREFVYVIGGSVNDGGAIQITDSVIRSKVLQPEDSPVFSAVDIDLVDDGVGPGLWYYKVSAVMDPLNTVNPSGETLPSEALPLFVPERVGKDFLVTLNWDPVPGAAGYRVFRTSNPNQSVNEAVHVVTVPGQSTTWVDDGSQVGDGRLPLALGEFGEWAAMPSLPTPTAGGRAIEVSDPVDSSYKYIYLIGGRTETGISDLVYRLTLEIGPFGYAPIGAWEIVGDPLNARRHEHGIFKVDAIASTRIPESEPWLFVGPGRDAQGDTRLLESAAIKPGGGLGPWSIVNSRAPARLGYGAVAAANQLFIFGGLRGDPSDDSISAQLCGIDGPCPDVGSARNFNSTAAAMAEARIHMGLTVGSAHIFLLGGSTPDEPATKAVEATIW